MTASTPTVTSGTLEGALHASPFGIVATQAISGVRVTVLCCPTIAAGSQVCHLTFSGPVGFTTTFLTELRGVAVSAPVVGGSVGATGTTAAASTGNPHRGARFLLSDVHQFHYEREPGEISPWTGLDHPAQWQSGQRGSNRRAGVSRGAGHHDAERAVHGAAGSLGLDPGGIARR